jgi:hypothetical protein
MGEKLISKNHLTPAPTFSFEVSLKNPQKSGNDFRKVSKWLKTWNMVKSNIEVSMQKLSLLKSAKIKLKIRISKFSSFIHYVVGLFILKTKNVV